MKKESRPEGSLLWYNDGVIFLTQIWVLSHGARLNIIVMPRDYTLGGIDTQ